MKKIISSILALTLLGAAGVPALAAAKTETAETVDEAPAIGTGGPLDARLSSVTTKVKSALPIDSLLEQLDGTPEFTGDSDEGTFSPRWSLQWSTSSGSIRVQAGEDGKVYSYYLNLNDSGNEHFWGLNASFPKADQNRALAAAQALADGLLGAGESVSLKSGQSGSTDSLSFSGNILFNGLPSPVDLYVQLRASDLTPTNFRRDDAYSSTRPEVPSAQSRTTAVQAAALLRGAVGLTPRYVLNQDGKTASLRYMLEKSIRSVVTADDGKLVDLDQVYDDLIEGYGGSAENAFAYDSASADAGAAPSAELKSSARLSDAELKTIEGLKDVHSREQLDGALRAVPALGLDSRWTLERVSYSQARKTGEISAQLRYTRPLTEAELEDWDGGGSELPQARKTITMDARTNALQSVYGSRDYYRPLDLRGNQDSPQTEEQRRAAEAFLSVQLPDKWKQCQRYGSENKTDLSYAQNVSGYPYPGNCIDIRMDAENHVERLSVSWDDKITFGSAENVISASAAVDAYMKAFEMPLAYVEYPILENRVLGQKYVLAYAFRQKDDRSFSGIDAITGEPVWEMYGSSGSFQYSDLEGAFGRTQIEALAAYGIGLKGESFEPEAALDQKTMLRLLLSACGDSIDPESEDWLDELYSSAYSQNLIKAADRDPDAAVTRMTFLRTLLGASIYGEAAKVRGVFTCPYTDLSSVPEADLGYAALAYGLGIARGDDKGQLNPNRRVTRQEAAVMLYNFMMR